MAHISEGDCPIAVGIMIRNEAKKENVSIRKMIEMKSKESGIPEATIDSWVYPRKKSNVKNYVTPKPTKKHTKPDVKIKLKRIVEEIKACKVSDTDIKEVVDATADLVSEGRASVRVVMKVPEALRKQRALKEYKSTRQRREKSDIDKMTETFHIFLERLDRVLAAGSKKLSNDDKRTMNSEFKLMVPRLLRLLDWIGIDLQSLVTNYVNHYKKELKNAKIRLL